MITALDEFYAMERNKNQVKWLGVSLAVMCVIEWANV